MKLEICVNCWNYQHRLNWMMCSILQQEGDIPEICFNLSYAPDNGDPITEEICKFFREQGLNIKETIVKDKKEVSCRGKIRQRQMDESDADWILFADCDMAYDSNFFAELKKRLGSDLKDIDKVITVDRVSLDIPFCTKFFKEDDNKYPCIIENVSEVVKKWPVWRVGGRRVGPGNFQLANMKIIRDKSVKYTHCCRDIWRSTRSDRHFRVNMGGIYPVNGLPHQYHLNHDRGGPDEQR